MARSKARKESPSQGDFLAQGVAKWGISSGRAQIAPVVLKETVRMSLRPRLMLLLCECLLVVMLTLLTFSFAELCALILDNVQFKCSIDGDLK